VDSSRISTKGQIVLPKALREARAWTPGTELQFEATADGVLIRAARLFPRSEPEQVAGCLAYRGKPKSIEDMDHGVLQEARRRYGSGRY
jgi:AbrB family looped-hinge helix DNA binding protein